MAALFCLSEDFSPATRLARRKLIEFGKTKKCVFQLRYNKLFINRQCYMYNSSNDTILELSNGAKARAAEDTAPVSSNNSRASTSS